MKNRIRLTESDLHRIVKESVNRVLNEIADETLGSLKDNLLAKREEMNNNPEYTHNERLAINNRIQKVHDELKARKYGTDENPTSAEHKGKFDQRERERQQGLRTYGDHYGNGKRMWRTMPKQKKSFFKRLFA